MVTTGTSSCHGGRPSDYSRVVALAPNDVWATGSSRPPSARRRTPLGRYRWPSIRAPFGPGDPIRGFTATSATDAWAVGPTGQRPRTNTGRTLGRHIWMIAPTPNQYSDSTLTDIHAASPSDIWALGQSSYMKTIHNPANCTRPCTEIHSSLPVAIYEHWNGQRWSLAPSSPQDVDGPTGITAAPDGTAWAIGGCYFGDVITRWNGHTWRATHHPPAIGSARKTFRPAGAWHRLGNCTSRTPVRPIQATSTAQ